MQKERFSREIIEQIRQSIYLPNLVQRYTRLNRNLKGLCPFHSEKHPSFSVDAKKGLWHCFGCNRGGDVFTFLMEAEHLTFPNAVKLLAFETGVRLPESDSIKEALSKKWEEKKKKLDKLNCLEGLFKDYENAIYSLKRFEAKCLPPKEQRNSKDYLKELLIEEDFDELERLIQKRQNLFEEIRNRIKYEK